MWRSPLSACVLDCREREFGKKKGKWILFVTFFVVVIYSKFFKLFLSLAGGIFFYHAGGGGTKEACCQICFFDLV